MANTIGSVPIVVIGIVGVGFISSIMVFVAGGGPLAIVGGLISLLGCAGAVLIWKFGYIFIPLITQRANVILMDNEGYEIPPTQDVIIKKSNNLYYASAFLTIRIFESTVEKSEQENVVYSQYFERAISDLKFVTKITYLLYVEDVAEKRKDIETKRAEAQLRLSRERDKPQPDVIKIDRYERELAMWDVQLNKLIKGVKPMGVVAYAQTTAADISKEGAAARAKEQAKTLKTVLANSLNVEIEFLTGDQMLKCFEWERFYPITPADLEEAVA
ncbi:hypothetical protein HY990_00675 [Candidatus Micrarchaeota archaeon]|nr:hypothetical protein [Candidatus Micrarchaeota archaeon]